MRGTWRSIVRDHPTHCEGFHNVPPKESPTASAIEPSVRSILSPRPSRGQAGGPCDRLLPMSWGVHESRRTGGWINFVSLQRISHDSPPRNTRLSWIAVQDGNRERFVVSAVQFACAGLMLRIFQPEGDCRSVTRTARLKPIAKTCHARHCSRGAVKRRW